MSLNNENIWFKSILVFDSCSIIRFYEWYKNKSLELKDIFDCKTQDILLLEHVKKEVLIVTEERLEQKKNKFIGAFKFVLEMQGKEKALKSLEKQNDGYKFPREFIHKLKDFVNGRITKEEISQYIEVQDMQDNLLIEGNDIKSLMDSFFSREFASILTVEKIEEEYNSDVGIDLPGYKDKNKDENKFGDYIIMNQLVEVANSSNKDITFITADFKADWFPYNKKAKQKQINPRLKDWFDKKIISGSKITVVTLSQMLQIASNYISDDFRNLVDEEVIFNLVLEKYNECYQDDLMDIITNYIEDDPNIQPEIENAIQCCLDNLSFGENEHCDIKNIEYCMKDYDVIVTFYVDFYLTLDASAHCGGEDFDLGSPSCHFSGEVVGTIPIEWASESTEAISLGSKLEDIEIKSIEFLDVDPLFKNPEEDYDFAEEDYAEDDYAEEDYYDCGDCDSL